MSQRLQKGYSMMEMMIVVGMGAVMSLVIGSMANQMSSQQNLTREQLNLAEFKMGLNRLMISGTANLCTSNFAGTPVVAGAGPFPVLVPLMMNDPLGHLAPRALVTVGNAISGSTSVQVASIVWQNVVQTSSTTYMADLVVNFKPTTTRNLLANSIPPLVMGGISITTDAAANVVSCQMAGMPSTTPTPVPKGFCQHTFTIPDNSTWIPLGPWDMCYSAGNLYAGAQGGTQIVKSGAQSTAPGAMVPGPQNADGTYDFYAYNQPDPCYNTPMFPVTCYTQGQCVSGKAVVAVGGAGGAACPGGITNGGMCSTSAIPTPINCTSPASVRCTPYGCIPIPARNEIITCNPL